MAEPTPEETRTNLEQQKLELEIKALPERQKLERTKLELEIKSLKNGFLRTLATALLTATVTMLIAVGGWMVDRSKAREDARQAVAKRHDEIFANVLQNFSSPNPSTRAATTVILPQFATADYEQDQVITLLVNRLSNEDDVAVIEQIVAALQKIGRPALSECVKSNKRAQAAFARAIGRYAGLLASNYSEQERVLDELASYLRSIEFPDEFQHPRAFFSVAPRIVLKEATQMQTFARERKFSQIDTASVPSSRRSSEIISARSSIAQKWRYLRATSLAIVGILRSLSGELNHADVAEVMITDGDLRHLDLRGINLRNGIFINGNFESANLSCADLSSADLRTSLLANAKVRGTKLDSTILGDLDVYVREPPDFTGSNWWDARWEDPIGEAAPASDQDRFPAWLESRFPRAKQELVRDATQNQCFDK